MKKLNITKKHFNESKYFQDKYGKLEYVSESGKIFKTSKGKVLKFVKESSDFSSQESEVTIHWLIDDEVLGITVDDEETIVVDLDLIDPEYPDTLVEAVQFELKKMYKGMSFECDDDFIIKNEDEFWDSLGVKPNRTGIRYESKDRVNEDAVDEDLKLLDQYCSGIKGNLNDSIDPDGLSIKNRITNFIGWKDSKSKGKFVKKSDNDEMN